MSSQPGRKMKPKYEKAILPKYEIRNGKKEVKEVKGEKQKPKDKRD